MTDSPEGLTHLDPEGRARMVDVSKKPPTERLAVAEGFVAMNPETLSLVTENRAAKGNVLETARIAAILAAKKTADLIPLCHPLPLTHVAVDFFPKPGRIVIRASARVTGPTGVEMEALTAVAAAGLTIYDMVKAVDKTLVIGGIRLLEKSGGKSGRFTAPDPPLA